MHKELSVVDRGLENFSRTLAYQNNVVRAKVADSSLRDILILVEHESIYTTGRGVCFQKPLHGIARNIPWVETNRGGQVTWHGPGQLVVYPIFDLSRHIQDVNLFLRAIENAAIGICYRLNIGAMTREGFTGVWVRLDKKWLKIASLGIGIKSWVSYHGIAFNLNPDLSYFRAISPCGGDGKNISSLACIAEKLGLPLPSINRFKQIVVEEFYREFNFNSIRNLCSSVILRPSWLKVKIGRQKDVDQTMKTVRKNRLFTVCEESHCPNVGECWSHGIATFMIMGKFCTRRCNFCSVKDGTLSGNNGHKLEALNPFEPLSVAQTVRHLGLEHVVITSVNRDDLPDMGASHFDKTVRAIHKEMPSTAIELLIPDMQGKKELVNVILSSGLVDILNHNVETVPRIYRSVRPGAQFFRSLDVLSWAKEILPNVKTKSGLMVGLGEQKAEVLEVMDALRQRDVDILTIGQYLQPTEEEMPIASYVRPEVFAWYAQQALKRGFKSVNSGPFVRSSYHAWEHSQGSLKALKSRRPDVRAQQAGVSEKFPSFSTLP